MTTIKGERYMTLSLTAGEIYKIVYEASYEADIKNGTSGQLKLSADGAFADSGVKGSYLTLEAGEAFNGFHSGLPYLCLIAESSGTVVVGRYA